MCEWLRHYNIVVIPAKAGIQGLNNKAALWAAFHYVSPSATQKIIRRVTAKGA